MRTRDLLSSPEEEALGAIAAELMQFKSYKEGIRCPKENAKRIYAHALKMHNYQRRWWKLVITSNGNHIIWTDNSSETVLIGKDGEVKYDDEVGAGIPNCNLNHLAHTLPPLTYLSGTRAEIIEKIKNDDFRKDGMSNSLPPVSLFLESRV